MSSITVKDIKNMLEDVPDDYQVIMVLTKKNEEEKAVLSMINGFQVLDINREVRLLNWLEIVDFFERKVDADDIDTV